MLAGADGWLQGQRASPGTPQVSDADGAEKGRRRAGKRMNSLRPLQIVVWGLEVEKLNVAWTPSGIWGDKSIFRWLLGGDRKPCCVCYHEHGSKLFAFMALLARQTFWGADGGGSRQPRSGCSALKK